jgi:hypothetical protein
LREPWHYTTFVDFLDHWQTLIAGLVGFGAAIFAVVIALRIERLKTDREMKALREALAVELRHMVTRAFGAFNLLNQQLQDTGTSVTTRMLADLSRVPAPVVYLASADKIGFLGADAMDVVIFYNLIEIARAGVESLMRHRTPDNLPVLSIAAIALAFLQACMFARGVLPRFKTGVSAHDEKDNHLIRLITEAATAAKRTPVYQPLVPQLNAFDSIP